MTLRAIACCAAFLAGPLAAEEQLSCPAPPRPVLSLDFGSRYAEDSATRSEFDEEGDKAVTAALKPIDDFIADLARQTDILLDPETEPKVADAAAKCVVESLLVWAEADALSDLSTQGANLSVPSRIGGMAFAYAAVRAYRPDAPGHEAIERWLLSRARQTMAFFDAKAPPRASRNNLRAWAGLAVARVGLTLDDPDLVDWGAGSAELVACTAAADGSLPNEMWRGRLALHYQLHAVGPLVVTAALLREERPGLVEACDAAIPRIVRFTLAALDDPSTVEKITGKTQSVGGPERPARDFELAWLAAYLKLVSEPIAQARIERVEKLGNSKLGGDQRLLWPTAKSLPATDG